MISTKKKKREQEKDLTRKKLSRQNKRVRKSFTGKQKFLSLV